MTTDDESLARQAGSGDRKAFELLLEGHYDRIYRIGFGLLGETQDAEDLAQDVCVTLARKLKSYRGDSRFTTWLYRVVVNAARDTMRRRASGHTVTAIYELTPVGSGAARIDELRYQPRTETTAALGADEYGFLKIRFKLPDSDTSTLISLPVTRADEADTIAAAPREARFAAAVAGFGQLLRGGRYTGDIGYDDVIELAQGAKGDDPFGYRAEFINLVRLAKSAADMEALKQ